MTKNSNLILEEGKFYHIYNRGINGTNLFYEAKNYTYFLSKYAYYMYDFLDTYAYCLMKNHFHLLVRVKELPSPHSANKTNSVAEKGLHSPEYIISKRFADLFNSYTKSINTAYSRTGRLFETPFRRILVETDAYFTQLIWYIHFNPQKHGFVADYKEYAYSSYHSHLSQQPTKLNRKEVLEWFGNAENYVALHQINYNEHDFSGLLIEFD